MSRSRGGAAAAVVIALSWPAPAGATAPPTIYDNYQTFPVGSRAAGMAGAYTALACDEGALHYNPGALSCASASHLELAANAYVLNGYSVPNAFGKGEDISAVTYHSIPSIVGGVRILSEGDPETQVGRFAFGLTVSVPQSLAVKAEPTSAKRSFFKYRERDDLTAGDIGLGYQITRWLGLGVSIGAVLRTSESASTTLIASQNEYSCGPGPVQQSGCHGFLGVTNEEELLALGARAKIGARFTPTRALSLGLTVTSPSLHIFGSSKLFATQLLALPTQFEGDGVNPPDSLGTALYDAGPVRLEGSSEVGLPMRIAAGVAYVMPKLTLSLDVSANLPRAIKIAYARKAIRIKGVTPPDKSDIKDEVLHRDLQPNVNVGAEFAVLENLVIDAGAFTDLSSVSDADVRGTDDASPQDRIHMFGGSLAVGILSAQSRGWFGLSFEAGKGSSKVLKGDLTLDNAFAGGLGFDANSTATRWTLAGMIGSNYSFLPEKPAAAPPPKAAPPTPAGGTPQ